MKGDFNDHSLLHVSASIFLKLFPIIPTKLLI